MTWENDDRGKPCKWQERIVVDRAELEHGLLPVNRQREIALALQRCRAAVAELQASDDIYVIRVPPEVHRTEDGETMQWIFNVRARVRWCPDKATAERYGSFEGQFSAAVDDEFARCLAERAKHGTVR